MGTVAYDRDVETDAETLTIRLGALLPNGPTERNLGDRVVRLVGLAPDVTVGTVQFVGGGWVRVADGLRDPRIGRWYLLA